MRDDGNSWWRLQMLLDFMTSKCPIRLFELRSQGTSNNISLIIYVIFFFLFCFSLSLYSICLYRALFLLFKSLFDFQNVGLAYMLLVLINIPTALEAMNFWSSQSFKTIQHVVIINCEYKIWKKNAPR